MATTVNSTLGAIHASPTAKNKATAEIELGNVSYIETSYTINSVDTLVNGDRIYLGDQPENTRIISPDVSIATDGLEGTSAIGSIGVEGNTDAISGALTVDASAFTRADGGGDEARNPFTATVKRALYFTLTTLTASMTVGKKIVFRIPLSKA